MKIFICATCKTPMVIHSKATVRTIEVINSKEFDDSLWECDKCFVPSTLNGMFFEHLGEYMQKKSIEVWK